jgi:chemotaxis protein MotA
MDIISVFGMIFTIVFVLYGILVSGSLLTFYDFSSVLIVFGGTFGAIFISCKIKNVQNFIQIIKIVFIEKKADELDIINNFLHWAVKARKSGILSLEDEVEQIQDAFIKKGLMMIVDGAEPETIKRILGLRIKGLIERHKSNRNLMNTGASMAPAFGMIGTLIGLVNMLKTIDDPSTIGPQMSVALITTFYGSMLANIVFIPMSKKLKAKTDDEVYKKEMIIEALLSLQAGENPNILKEKMLAYLNGKDNKKLESYVKKSQGDK